MGRRGNHHLRGRVVAEVTDRDRDHDLEHVVQNQIRNDLVDECHLFRANVGRGWQGVGKPFKTTYPMAVHMNPGDVLLRSARPFDTGLPSGFADTFGWKEVEITPDMVGQTVAMFIALEIKSQTGACRDHQIAFVNAVNSAGGRAGFARSVEDARDIIRGDHARINLQPGTAQDRAPVAGQGQSRAARAVPAGAAGRRGHGGRG